MKYTRKFAELNKNSAGIAGGKGASLGEMLNVGIPVPDGFVVLSSTFERFIELTDLGQEIDTVLHGVDHKAIHTIDQAAEKIKALILSRDIPADIKDEIKKSFEELNVEYVAVRSSATAEDGAEHAWAGQLDSYLNIKSEDVIEKVQHCWASLFTPRAIFYRFEKGMHTLSISVAVVIQKMVNSEKSGIAFSVHPVTEDRNQLVIEAGLGLGEAIVSGSITPDSYVVEKEPRRIIDINISNQNRALYRKAEGGNEWIELNTDKATGQVLTESEVLELSELVLTIEKYYSFPCDIEWAFEAGIFFIVQSRPITTLSNGKHLVHLPKKDDYILTFWTRGVNIVVTDICKDMFIDLDPLFIIDKGFFKQYFRKEAFEKSLEYGVKLYGDNNAFDKYQENLKTHCKNFQEFFENIIKDKEKVTEDQLQKFFDYSVILCKEYSKMDFEYTDKAFTLKEQNKSIERNLGIITTFKDEVRAFMNTVFFEPNGYLNQLLQILGKQFNKDTALLENLTRKELLGLFEGLALEESKVLQRQEAFAALNDHEVPYYEGSEAKAIIKQFEDKINKDAQIKGTIANKGKMTGKVKIITVDYSDFAKMNSEIEKMDQGDVLVAETTAPELIVACKKAGAIVTDIGGLMSHAAIVSRELGIPCIVGTKDASKVLKDGDVVEVDANEGTVRKISQYPDLADYIRLFEVSGMPFFVNDTLSFNYRRLGALFFLHNGYWSSYLPKSTLAITYAEAEELFISSERFIEYKENFENYKKSSSEFFERTLAKEALMKEEVESALKYLVDLHRFYIKTEFFYTDRAFELHENPVVAANLNEIDYIKNSGREHLNKAFFGESAWINKLLNTIAQQFNIDRKLANQLSHSEILSLFENIMPDIEVLKSRENGYVSDYTNNKEFYGEEAKKYIDKILAMETTTSETLKGSIANKGTVTAIARVFKYGYDNWDSVKKMIEEMKEGDVLITETTSPELLVACKKASAILTNQGGMMSHAAIVSRELNIPCIVGLGNATHVINTGDTIEVNADEGLVKIKARV
jgi:phosphoenolpyruvate synthase/pyruvate phosphate dikinase